MDGVSLNLVVVRLPDVERAAAFYAPPLGCPLRAERHRRRPPNIWPPQLGSMVLEIYPQARRRPIPWEWRLRLCRCRPSVAAAVEAV